MVKRRRNNVSLDERRNLITDAGELVPGFTKPSDGLEVFVHSPLAVRQDDNTVEDRNNDAIVVHMSLIVDDEETKLFLASDVGHEILADIVKVTEKKYRYQRLEWDIFKLPHHCSHHSLSSEPREGDKSKPESKVARLFEHYGQKGCVVVSTSDVIPKKGSKKDKEKGANPPHRQAANYYREDVVGDENDDFKVTMEHPKADKPSPLEIKIDQSGPTIEKENLSVGIISTSSFAPRAG